MKAMTLILAAALALTAAGCASSPLRQRAAFDMNCPEGDIEIVDLGDNTRGASGCNKHATYILDSNGRWVANTPVFTKPAPK